MLKLKRVELQGFKSFCDRTELRFNGDGIAAVVGPNGCGKSNISDAISWVLGEQSAKSLRGARMEDVIFAGTRDRKPLGMAYVTMTLVDPERLPRAHATHKLQPGRRTASRSKSGEITITRRLYRSGESEYLIDGRAARLRDIQDIFMGTGLGPESYAIIEQGRIGQILSSKPQDRRAVIEEAAGITKFKTRKRLAEAKLEGAKQNLARVFDILEEVTRQVNSLKRQAAKAKRYGELKAELEAPAAHRARPASTACWSARPPRPRIDLEPGRRRTERRSPSRWPNASRRTSAAQAACYEIEAAADRSAPAASGHERGGRAHARPPGIAGQGKRRHRAAHRAGREGIAGARRCGWTRSTQEIAGHKKNVDALEAQIAQARERMMEINQQREGLQAKVREREQRHRSRPAGDPAAAGRSFHAEESARADRRVPGRHRARDRPRPRAKSRSPPPKSSGSKRRASSFPRPCRSASWNSKPSPASAAAPKRNSPSAAASRSNCAARSTALKSEVLADPRAQGIARTGAGASHLHHRIGEAPVRRARKGQGRRLQAARRAGRLRRSGSAVRKARRRIPARRAGICRGGELGAGRARARLHPRRAGGPRHVPGAPGAERPTATAHLPEPAIGPETGIAARLSDSLRLTNGFKDRAVDLLPRALLLLPGGRSRSRRSAWRSPIRTSTSCCPTASAITATPDRRQEDGAGPLALKREARELAAQAARRGRTRWTSRSARLEELKQEIVGARSRARTAARAAAGAREGRVALDHEMRKLGEDLARANSRALGGAPGTGAPAPRAEKSRRAARAQSRRRGGEGAPARASAKQALEAERQELEKLEGQAATIGEEHAATARRAGRPRRAASRRTHRHGPAGAAVPRDHRRAASDRAEIERLGEQRARLLTDNIELDQKAAALAEQITDARSARQSRWRRRTPACAKRSRAGEEELKMLRAAVEESHEKRSQIEVELVRKQAELKFLDETSRKELNCPVEELAPADEPIPDADAIAEAEQAVQRSAQPHRGAGRGESGGHGGIPGSAAAPRLPERAAAGPDRFHPRHREGDSGDRRVSRQKFAEAFEAINANFRAVLPDAVRRRHGRDAPDRSGEHRRIAASTSSARLPARGCRTCCCFRAARRRWPRWRC